MDKDIRNAINEMNKAIEVEASKEVITAGEIDATEVETTLMSPFTPKMSSETPKIGRPTKMTEAMQAILIKLAEELFFIRSVAGEAGISVDTIDRHLKDERFKPFASLYTHALNKFIAYHQRLLIQYSKDKKTKDWRAEKYILTIADKEYSERKYLTDAVSNQDAKINMLINAEKLTLAVQEGSKMLKEVDITPSQEKIGLLPFNEKKIKQSTKAGKKKRPSAPQTVD